MSSFETISSLDNKPTKNLPVYAEYAGSIRGGSHIPPAELIYKDDMPVRLHTSYGDYEVHTRREKTSADLSFGHKTEKYDDGAIRSISFSNRLAYEYTRSMLSSYKSSSIKDILRSMESEMELEHYQQPGSYNNPLKQAVDKLRLYTTRKMLELGEDRDNNNLLGDIENTVDFLINEGIESIDDFINEILDIRYDENNNTIYFNEHDLFSDLNLEVIEWIKDMQEAKIPITMQRTILETKRGNCAIRRIIIGENKLAGEDSFLVEEKVLQTGMFSAVLFGHSLARNVTIFDNLHFDQKNFLEFSPGGVLVDLFHSPKSNKFNGSPASKYGNLIFLNTSGRLRLTPDNHIDVKRNIVNELSFHEAAHYFDEYKYTSTLPQREAYAASVQYGFLFSRCIHELRNISEYHNEITFGKLDAILSKNPPEQLRPVEVYEIPAAFFSYIYEQLGREKFAQFYGLLTGGEFYRGRTRKEDLITSIVGDSQEDYYSGNMMACFSKVMSTDERYAMSSPREFVDKFLQVVNSKEKM